MTPRITTEEMETEPAWWTITLVGGPNDGDSVRGEGYASVAPPGMWVLGVARVDRMPGTTIMAEFTEEVQIRYELIPGSEDFTQRTAQFRYVETQ